MISILCSKFEKVIDQIINNLKEMITENAKVIVLPWAFPIELDAEKFEEEYFKKGEKRYNRYWESIKKLGIKEQNYEVLNCYKITTEILEKKIKQADIILLPGGNPEMFYEKGEAFKISKKLKECKGIIIGESAGAVLHLNKYFLTEENNFYKRFEYYKGWGILQDNFEIDVHTINTLEYLKKLQHVAEKSNKRIYAIFDDGAISVNRTNNEVAILSNTKIINP